MIDMHTTFVILSNDKVDESSEVADSHIESSTQAGSVWSIRLHAARACAKLLRRSNFLVYDVFYTRVIAQLIHALTDPRSSSSVIHSILSVFEQLGPHESRVFLVPRLLETNLAVIFASTSILDVLERIAEKMLEQSC